MLTLITLSLLKRLKNFKNEKLKKIKKTLPLCGTAVQTCRCAARRQGPGAAPPHSALALEPGSCRRAPRRQGLNAAGCDGRSLPPWSAAPDVHFSKILIRPFIFRKS
jgi:hypothetical protein